jgi:competence protein ComEA
MRKWMGKYGNLQPWEIRGHLVLLIVLSTAVVIKWYMNQSPATPLVYTFIPDSLLENSNQSNKSYSNQWNNLRPFAFNPNSIDSHGLQQMGWPSYTIQKLLNWRSKGKQFYKAEDLAALYGLPDSIFSILHPYIVIPASDKRPSYTGNTKAASYRIPASQSINLNTVDSKSLVQLPGIGPYYAHQILQLRQRLGGYRSVTQIKSLLPQLADSTATLLENVGFVRAQDWQYLDLNHTSEAVLAAHPYIGSKLAKSIIAYRNNGGQFEQISDLRYVPLIDEEKYRKIAPYIK